MRVSDCVILGEIPVRKFTDPLPTPPLKGRGYSPFPVMEGPGVRFLPANPSIPRQS